MRELNLAASPHIHDGSSVRGIMLAMIVALSPALAAATVLFGLQALILAGVTVFCAVFFEWLAKRVMKKETSSVFDLSAAVSGLILALGLPANTPLWVAAVGAAVAVLLVRRVLGGLLGRNPVNPALAGHIAVAMLSRTDGYPAPLAWLPGADVDAAATATPLQLLAEGAPLPGFGQMLLGVRSGSMGETAVIALFLGGAYLVWRRVITPAVPLVFIGTTLLVLALAGQDPFVHLLSGALVFVAIFMATDYSTSPLTMKGKIIFAVGCGLITAIFRLPGGGLTDGISFALVTMNLLVPLIDRFTLPAAFGRKNR